MRRAFPAMLVGAAVIACGAPPVSPTSGGGTDTSAVASGSPPTASAAPAASADPTATAGLTASQLTDRIDPDALRTHLAELQAIADAPGSGGNRATGTPGFEASVHYVERVLDSAGYEVRRLPLDVGTVTSWNLVVERPGTGGGVFVLGAHLDSVKVGPGINDNASGVAALLAVATALAELPEPSVTVRFAFWGAEEGGPFGSRAYVDSLPATEIAAIRGYLNFDMLGSPNGVTFVYHEPGAAQGSEAIHNVISSYFDRRGLPWEPIDLAGDSDHGPFTAAGVPTGGLFSGGREPVTEAQATRHGAVAGQPADGCSHAACDTIDNVDPARLALMTDAIASILVTLASDSR